MTNIKIAYFPLMLLENCTGNKILHQNQVSVREDGALLCFTFHFCGHQGSPSTPAIWEDSLVNKHHQGSHRSCAQQQGGPQPTHVTKQESSLVTLKGLSNVTGTFDLKLYFNLFHHVARDPSASRKRQASGGTLHHRPPSQGTFLTRAGVGLLGSKTMPENTGRTKGLCQV